MNAFDVIVDDDAGALSKILKRDGLEVLSTRNSKVETVLHRAATYGSLECMKLLLKHHVDALDLNAVNAWNETALHLLASSSDTNAAECCKLLLEYVGGDDDDDDDDKHNYSLLTEEDQWGRTAMSVALDYNQGKDRTQRGYNLQPIDMIAQRISAAPLEIRRAVRASIEKYEVNKVKQKEVIEAEKVARASIIVDRNTLNVEKEKLKKTETVIKTIFSAEEGGGATTDVSNRSNGKSLSSCLEYPLDLNLLKALVAKEGNEINVNGKDYFGLNILHKLAAWNASADAFYIILPYLEESTFSAFDIESGFTPLHHTLMSGNLELAGCLLAHNPALKDVKAQKEGSQSAREILMAQPLNEMVDQFRAIFEDEYYAKEKRENVLCIQPSEAQLSQGGSG